MKNLLKTKQILLSSLIMATALLAACGGDKQEITLDSVLPTTEQAVETKGSPIFDPLTGKLPFPNDLLFAGSTDGTLNIPVADVANIADPKNSLNELDGFAVSGAISVGLSKAMDSTTLQNAVKVFQVTTDPLTKAVTGITATLTYGVDYFPSLVANDTTLVISPLKVLVAKTSYMVVISDDLLDVDGLPAISGATYAYLKLATPLIDASGNSQLASLPDASAARLEPVRQLTQAQLGHAATAGVDVSKVVMSWSFTTQSTTDVIDKVTSNVTNTSLILQNTGINTSSAGVPNGTAKIFAGTLTVPYYQTAPTSANPIAPLTSKWAGQSGNILTQYSIAAGDTPKKTADVTIPVIATTPAAGCASTGCPTVIYQHGITTNRTTVLAVADAYAIIGFATIAIDLPMHGITATNSAAAFRIDGVTERTFGVDFVTQNNDGAITAATPDGVVDTSGRHFVQLGSLLTIRDNLRQGVSDLVQLKASLATATGINFDENNVHFLGHSLGGMVGASFVNIATDLKTASFAMSGTQAAYILTNSASFGPEIAAGLAQKGIEAGSADFASFELAAQAVIDSADPISVLADISVPTLLLEVVGDGNPQSDDQVIPNYIAPLGGTEAWARVQGLNSVTGTGAVTDSKGIIRFTAGDHGSILSPAASLETTMGMQQAVVSFAATNGTAVQIANDTTIKQ